jgi:hypothetical protein
MGMANSKGRIDRYVIEAPWAADRERTKGAASNCTDRVAGSLRFVNTLDGPFQGKPGRWTI